MYNEDIVEISNEVGICSIKIDGKRLGELKFSMRSLGKTLNGIYVDKKVSISTSMYNEGEYYKVHMSCYTNNIDGIYLILDNGDEIELKYIVDTVLVLDDQKSERAVSYRGGLIRLSESYSGLLKPLEALGGGDFVYIDFVSKIASENVHATELRTMRIAGKL